MNSTTDEVNNDTDTTQTPTETLAQCDTVADFESLHRETISRDADRDTNRVKRVEWSIISQPADIVKIQSGDKLIPLDDQPTTDIIAVGDDIASEEGIHIVVDHPQSETQTIHLGLIRRWFENDKAVIAGTRSREFTELQDEDGV